ncbi:hypothetical protein C1B90_24060 [Salmonella enterica]|uniref:Uncharacterized protein n=1 Tax=Salmonella enterica TaxID=28901 RepID=A0A5T4LPV9_SALER|nr:hypothetical protein [Salmonella enterica]EBL7519097.1 hypothetical protein [Salmonella enterica]
MSDGVKKRQNMYLFCEDNYIREGLKYLRSVVVKPGLDSNVFPEPGGLIAIVPGRSSTADRIRVLSLSRLLPQYPHWHGIVLHDGISGTGCYFTRLTGLPVINLQQAEHDLETAIQEIGKQNTGSVSACVKNLTQRQWVAIRDSLDGYMPSDSKHNRQTLFTHRRKALDKLNLRHMHEFRRVVSGCLF